MASALLFILLLSGLWALASGASRQFYLVEEKSPWEEAQKQCREKYTDLATIENEGEMNAVKELLKGKTGNNFWIGLKQNFTNSWVWSDGTPLNYTYWSTGEPSDSGKGYCVEVYGTDKIKMYYWNDAKCDYSSPFICYKKRPPITVVSEKKPWREALRFCRQNHVDLLYIHSGEMQQWVEYAIKNATTDLWIGLRHTCTLGFWYWVSGETVCYQNWAAGNGSGVEVCNGVERTGALLAGSKKWVSLPQTQQLNFVCITF